MKEKIDKFLEYLSNLTKEEADFIESALKWDSETRVAFIMAKRIFEEKEASED